VVISLQVDVVFVLVLVEEEAFSSRDRLPLVRGEKGVLLPDKVPLAFIPAW